MTLWLPGKPHATGGRTLVYNPEHREWSRLEDTADEGFKVQGRIRWRL